jgi:hypothetical protein
VPIADEPEDPNACPYKTVESFWEHIQSQPEYLAWRAAPIEQRASHARQMAKRFHPDKYGARVISFCLCQLWQRVRGVGGV